MIKTNIFKRLEGRNKIMECYEKVLATWPVPCETKTIKNQIAEGFVIACGPKEAPPLVLFHGSGSNSMTWAGEVILLSRFFRIYALDLPGEPGKSQAVRYDWQGQEYMDWISQMLDALGIGKFYMGGLSLGGGFALKYACQFPQRILSLILISPGGVVPVKFNLKLVWYALQGKKGFHKMMNYLFPGASLNPMAEEFMQLTAAYFNYGQGQPPNVSDADLEHLSMPVFYYAGQKDPLVNTQATIERLKKHVPGITVRVFEDKGHLVLPLAKEIIRDLKMD